MAVSFMIYLTYIPMISVVPAWLGELGIQPGMIGLVTGLTTFVIVIARPFFGIGVDRFGRRLFLVLGIVGLACAIVPLAFVPVLSFIIALRLLLGLAWGAGNTAINTIAADTVPKTRFGEGIGYFSLASTLAAAIGPALCLSLMQAAGFGAVSMLCLALCVVALVGSLAIRYKPVDKATALARVSVGHVFTKDAVLPGVVVFFLQICSATSVSFVALIAAQRHIPNISLLFVASAVAMMISRPFFGRWMDRHGPAMPTILGFAATAASTLLVAFAPNLGLMLAAGFLNGLGIGAVSPAMQTIAVSRAGANHRGAATSTYFILYDLGMGLGVILGGALANVFGYAIMFVLMVIPCAIGLLVFVAATDLRHESSPQTPRQQSLS